MVPGTNFPVGYGTGAGAYSLDAACASFKGKAQRRKGAT